VSPPAPRRLLVGLAIVLGLGLFVGANVHLVRVSLASQPDCVPHLKAPGEDGRFRAARSSC
jgi:hypothetical protein